MAKELTGLKENVDEVFSGTRLENERDTLAQEGRGGAVDVVTAGGWEQSQPPNFCGRVGSSAGNLNPHPSSRRLALFPHPDVHVAAQSGQEFTEPLDRELLQTPAHNG